MLTDHKINELNALIEIVPGSGPDRTDCPLYRIFHKPEDGSGNDSFQLKLQFQDGTLNEVGVNGITTEVLIAIALDRLRRFQRGAQSCRHNSLAITKLEESLHWLAARSRDRDERGVEGTREP